MTPPHWRQQHSQIIPTCVQHVVMNRDNQTFAATRPAAVLLEQLAMCVAKGEPVLLVGETGTGKTSTVQHLARVTGESEHPPDATQITAPSVQVEMSWLYSLQDTGCGSST